MREDPKLLPDPEYLDENRISDVAFLKLAADMGYSQARLVRESVVVMQKYCIRPHCRRLVIVSKPRLNGREGQRSTDYYACAEQIRKN